jgi:hypothetical protein
MMAICLEFSYWHFSWLLLLFRLKCCDIVYIGRLEQVSWSLPVVSTKERYWLRNETEMWTSRRGKCIASIWLLEQILRFLLSIVTSNEIWVFSIYIWTSVFLSFAFLFSYNYSLKVASIGVEFLFLCKWLPIVSS